MRKNENVFKSYNPSISLIKVIAMFLIIQSHVDILFPAKLSFLATGGALGNELFFLVGGYLYSTKKGIINTSKKRFIRLYIPTYIMTILLYIFKVIDISTLNNIREIVYRMIWPTSFWFVSAIFFFGIILHYCDNVGIFENKKVLSNLLLLFIILYILIYVFCVNPKDIWIVEDIKLFGGMFYFKCLYSFFVFCTGFYIKKCVKEKKITFNNLIMFRGSVISFLLFYLFKYLLNKQIIPMELQIISQPITIVCVIFIFLWISNSQSISVIIRKRKRIRDLLNELGSITLEAFLIQFELIKVVYKWNVRFPINYILAIVLIVFVARIFKALNTYVCAKVEKSLIT